MSAFGVYPYHRHWLGVCDISSGVGCLYCLFVLQVAKTSVWDKLMQWPALFFMDLSGNRELLDRTLVAFFASRNAPPEALDLATRWAQEIAQTDKVVISGFHSPIERAVLDILLAHDCSVVVTLGRSLYHKIPAYLQTAYNNNRVLFISFRDYSRQSRSNSQIRNWATADLASELIFAPFDSTSQLSTLHFTYSANSTILGQ